MKCGKLWIAVGLVLVVSPAALGRVGFQVIRSAPPIPAQVVTPNGNVLSTHDDIVNSQNVRQSMGGQEVGTVWGDGACVASDWTADWLHREAVFVLDQ
jgi:nitric oxide reductase subunit B